MLRLVAMFTLLLAGTLSLIGCTTTDATMVDARDFMQTAKQAASVQVATLAPGDMIEISVEVDGSMEVLRHRAGVNHLGFVTLPLVGDVSVGGVSLNVARSVIAKRYGTYYVNSPVIMLSIVDDDATSEWGQVTVLGRVNSPGVVPLPSASGISLSAAIQSVGGFAASAKTTEIRVSRVDGKGKKIQVTVNFNEIGKSGNAEADLKLVDGDIVFIPERIF